MVTQSAPRQTVFRAIAAPARRSLIDELARGPRSAGALAERFPESRPAIARHLRVLRRAGLVSVLRSGRNRIYSLRPAPLRAVRDWLVRYERFWIRRLDELADYVEKNSEERGKS